MAQRQRDLLHWQGVSPAKLKNNKLFFSWRPDSYRDCEKLKRRSPKLNTDKLKTSYIGGSKAQSFIEKRQNNISLCTFES